jgi:DNA replication protein DnaC
MSTTTTDEREERLKQRLKALRLPGFLAHYADFARRAIASELDPIEFLAQLAEVEMTERSDRRLKRMLDDAELPEGKTLATLDLQRYPAPMRVQIQELCRGKFIDEAINIYLAGNSGTGKSHIEAAIGRACVELGIPVFYTTVAALVERLLVAKRDLRLSDEFKLLDQFECLCLDDIGYVKQDSTQMDVLFTLLAERYERKSLIISSNLRFSEWNQIFKDPVTTHAAVDRVSHHSVSLWFDGPSYRSEEAERRKAEAERRAAEAAKELPQDPEPTVPPPKQGGRRTAKKKSK